jgi:hypothetical protein
MRVIATSVLLVALMATVPVPTEANTGIAELEPAYVHEDGRLEMGDLMAWTFGQPFYAVGWVSSFDGPLAFLNNDSNGVEFTWCTEGMVSAAGSLSEDLICCADITIDAAGGSFKILRDAVPDADMLSPETFRDGEIILEGYFRYAFHLSQGGCCTGQRWSDVHMTLIATGGSAFATLSPEGSEVLIYGYGPMELAYDLPASVAEAGYFARFSCVLDAQIPIVVRRETWGRLKQLY